jgi:hypothetical protein
MATKAGASEDVTTDDATGTDVATLSAADQAAFAEFMRQRESGKKGPDRYKVVVSHKGAGDRVLFSSVSQSRARKHIERTCPRGQHHFLLNPDGTMESYEAERESGGPQGEDVEMWQPFDRDAYQAPELSPVNTNDPWADAWEGAQ